MAKSQLNNNLRFGWFAWNCSHRRSAGVNSNILQPRSIVDYAEPQDTKAGKSGRFIASK